MQLFSAIREPISEKVSIQIEKVAEGGEGESEDHCESESRDHDVYTG